MTRLLILVAAPAALLTLLVGTARTPAPPPARVEWVEPLNDVSRRILDAAIEDPQAYEKLCYLCDRIGPRLSGSKNLERAVDWAAEQMRRDGLSNVRKQKVMVPVWTRGEESARIVEPAEHPLFLLGLGGSVGTPPKGIVAEVVPVKSWEELTEERCRGKIVLFNVPFSTYGAVVPFRTQGAGRAAKVGAVATLVRSLGPRSLRTPHTGAMHYPEGVVKIPAAAVTIECAELIQRLVDRGSKVRVRLQMGARTLPDAESANVIGEVPGRTDEIVLLGGHLDSWDVGQGANDDGAGCAIVLEAARLLVKLGLRPKRTIRVALFTNEENGLAGGRAYRDGHMDELRRHVAAVESDGGGDIPQGFGLSMPEPADQQLGLEKLRAISRLLERVPATLVRDGGGGADISPLKEHGVPVMSHLADMSRYFDIHHTHADTVDKLDPTALARNAAAVAIMALALSEMPGRLGDGQAR
jgi:carboxypeptidase Q